MNNDHVLYDDFLKISNNWPLDDWSITKECFDNIIAVLPFGKTILEIGSGNSTRLLSKFYSMISIESNPEWMNRYESKYYLVPIKPMISEIFGPTEWLDIDKIRDILTEIDYDLLLVDAGGDRVGIYDNIALFKTDVPIIFDDTMDEGYLKCATLIADKYNKQCTTVQCAVNVHAVCWFNGKRYSIITGRPR